MCSLDLAAGDIVIPLLFQGNDLRLGQYGAGFSNMLLQCTQPLPEVRQLIAQPDRTYAGRADEGATLAQLVADSNLAMSRLLDGIRDHCLLNDFVHTILDIRPLSVLLQQRFYATIGLGLLVAIERIASDAHDLSGL